MNRKLLWGVLVIGQALAITPFALGMPGKSAAGQRMLNGFHPLMAAARRPDDRALLQQRLHPAREGLDAVHGSGFESADAEAARAADADAAAGHADLQAGAGRPSLVRAVVHDDAGERRQLQAGEQPARLPALHRLLRGAGRVARRARQASGSSVTSSHAGCSSTRREANTGMSTVAGFRRERRERARRRDAPAPRRDGRVDRERFRALAEPTRIKLLDRLREGEATVLELTALVGTTQQNVSKHLVLLSAPASSRAGNAATSHTTEWPTKRSTRCAKLSAAA